MRRLMFGLLALAVAFVTGCSAVGGTPKAVAPETKVDFGNVPVTNDLSQTKKKEFTIKNEGTGNLKLSQVQVKLLQGC